VRDQDSHGTETQKKSYSIENMHYVTFLSNSNWMKGSGDLKKTAGDLGIRQVLCYQSTPTLRAFTYNFND